MIFQERLANLREKPEHVRHKIAFWSSFGITAVIFLFWISSFATPAAATTSAAVADVPAPASPGTSLVAGVGDFGKDLWDIIFTPKKVTYSQIQVIPGNN